MFILSYKTYKLKKIYKKYIKNRERIKNANHHHLNNP